MVDFVLQSSQKFSIPFVCNKLPHKKGLLYITVSSTLSEHLIFNLDIPSAILNVLIIVICWRHTNMFNCVVLIGGEDQFIDIGKK